MRQFVFGDIHGCYEEFLELLQKIRVTNKDQLISIGDIVNKGEKSKEVFEYFANRPNSVVIIGNHEKKHLEPETSVEKEAIINQFGAQYSEFKKWLSTLNYFYETTNSIIIHAFWEHDKTIADQNKDVLSGTGFGKTLIENKYSNLDSWQKYYTGKKTIIYGHRTVGSYPVRKNNTLGIDTGCCYGLKLTALELPSYKIHQVNAKRAYRNLNIERAG